MSSLSVNVHPESRTSGIQPTGYRAPVSARVGRVTLSVSNLAASIEFYRDVIGLSVLQQSGMTARLGIQATGTELLDLKQLPGVKPIGKRSRLGLYHTAFLLPTREALSSFVQHLRTNGIQFGAGDHIYSEALYVTDPDGLSVEIYADRPQAEWPVEDRELLSGVDPVRFESLPEVPPHSWKGMPAGTTVGHMHFYVGDLKQAANFYHEGLGMSLKTWRYPGALFLAAGEYHHHVGLNVWAAGSPVAEPTDARLLHWGWLLPDIQAVRDAEESLLAQGYRPSYNQNGMITFTDPWGLQVELLPEVV